MFLHGKSQEWTCDPWFVKILRMPRSSEVHIDSTFPALPGGSFDLRLRGRLKPQNFVLPQQILNKSDMSMSLYLSCVSSPSRRTSSGHKHHHNHRLFCTYFLHPFTFYLQVPRHAAMHITLREDCRVRMYTGGRAFVDIVLHIELLIRNEIPFMDLSGTCSTG